jgi:hypothetical protein
MALMAMIFGEARYITPRIGQVFYSACAIAILQTQSKILHEYMDDGYPQASVKARNG